MNKDLFNVLEATRKALKGKLDKESQRYLDHCILERRLDGLHLDDETRQKVIELKERISDLENEFSKNCNEESTKLTFTLDQLSKKNLLIIFLIN